MSILENINNEEIKIYLKNNLIDNMNFFSFIFSDVIQSGWKIHISCTIKNYKDIMNLALSYFYENKINFKIIKNIEIYINNSRKTGDRTSFGKFITVYPGNKIEFIKIIEELYELLKYFEGPFILSDRRYRDSKVIYYRYGSNILENVFDNKGNIIRTYTYKNKKYIDSPKPYFELPDEIEDPLVDKYNVGNSSYLLKNYEIIEAIRFSPIGGIYKAKSLKNNNLYIVKEIYPHTGIYDDNKDAIYFAKEEIKNLKKLNSIKFISKLYEYFYDWDNFYLIREYIDGDTFEQFSGKMNPIPFYSSPKEVIQYCRDMLYIVYKIAKCVNILFENGYVITDMGPDNIIVNDDVYFIDLESLIKVADNKNEIINYTEGFWLEGKDIEENIKNNIANLILYSLNKKNSLFHIFTDKEILAPIIVRYPFIKYILEGIQKIRKDTTQLSKIGLIIKEIVHNIGTNEYEKIEVRNYATKSYSNILEKEIKLSYNRVINENSIAYGQLGKILANIYLNRVNYKKQDLLFLEEDFRTVSFFYGHSGLLYIYNLLNIRTDIIIKSIINNIDYSELSLSEGVSGVGIALLHDYKITKNKKNLKVLKKIKKTLIRNYFKNTIINIDTSLDTGILGHALFFIYYSFILDDEISKKYAKKCIDFCVRRINEEKYFESLNNNHKKEFYIKNGISGLILIILEYMAKLDENFNDEILKELLEDSTKVYSLSPNYYFGSSGFLYTFYKARKQLKEKRLIKIDFDGIIDVFYNDIINTLKNGQFFNTNTKYNNHGFLGGKEGIVTILEIIKENKELNIFPFII